MNAKSDHFQEFDFSQSQLEQFIESAWDDLKIAMESKNPQVIFRFSYDALIKISFAALGKHRERVRSTTGHHAKTIERLAVILKDPMVGELGDKMRVIRNRSLYEGIFYLGLRDCCEYRDFVQEILAKVKKQL